MLCLRRPFRTSSDILRTQMEIAGWERSLGDLVAFTCAPDGHPASGEVPKDVATFFPDAEYYEWWNATANEDGVVEYRGVDASLERVRDAFAADAFDGVLGFSQGATLTTVLAAKGAAEGWGPFADARGDASGNASPAMTFAVCVGGMLARTPAANALYEKAKAARASTPSLHLIGDADRVMPPSLSESARPRNSRTPRRRATREATSYRSWRARPWRRCARFSRRSARKGVGGERRRPRRRRSRRPRARVLPTERRRSRRLVRVYYLRSYEPLAGVSLKLVYYAPTHEPLLEPARAPVRDRHSGRPPRVAPPAWMGKAAATKSSAQKHCHGAAAKVHALRYRHAAT